LPVTTTTSMIATAYNGASQRQRVRRQRITAAATSAAHATCIDGMAASWLVKPVPGLPA
jgi:hypothetical protein